MTDDLDELTGGVRRALSTASLAGKLGKQAARRLVLRRAGNGGAHDGDAAAIARARALVATMGKMKGLVMKVGQIASYMPGALPPAAQAVLAELQASSTAMAWSRIDEVLARELGAAGRALFDAIDERPFAAASIGQVHRAVYAGRPVAVKVQYPGIEDAIRGDLRMVGAILRVSTLGSPLDGAGLSGELRARLLEECDYRLEADHQRLFGRLLSEIDGARVPGVVGERSSQRVLTTELADARPISELGDGAGVDQAIRDRAGQLIFRGCYEMVLRRCIYNSDPHPGNYLIGADGSVTFLDFGCVGRFEPSTIPVWRQMLRALIDGQRPAFEAGFRALGFVGKERGFDWAYQWDAMRFMYRPFFEPGFRYSQDFVRRCYGLVMFDNPNRARVTIPPAWLFLNRVQWGLSAVLAQLSAAAPWRDIMERLLAAPVEPA